MTRVRITCAVFTAALFLAGCPADETPDTGNGGNDLFPPFDSSNDPDAGGEDVVPDVVDEPDVVSDLFPDIDTGFDQTNDTQQDPIQGDVFGDTTDIVEDQVVTDAPVFDVVPDADIDTFVPPTPLAPAISSPRSGARVSTPLAVVGTAEPNADVSGSLRDGALAIIGSATGTADETGAFALAIEFTEGTKGANYSLRVFQTNSFGIDGPAAAVNLVQGGAPAAPVINVPSDGLEVVSPLTVSGTAELNSTVTVTLTDPDDDDAVLATESRAVASDGRYSFSLSFDAPTADAIDLSVVAENEFGVSTATTRSLSFGSFTISGRVFNNCASGSAPPCADEDGLRTEGDVTYVRVYTSPQSMAHIAEVAVETPGGADVDAEFEIAVPSGNYYLRAYRDFTGFDDDLSDEFPGPADGEPTLPQELQTMGPVNVFVDDATVTGVELELEDAAAAGTAAFGFDGYAFNESTRPEPPSGGSGLCGGYYLFFQGVSSDSTAFSDPVLIRPTGEIEDMADDGGCASGGDNSSDSFDLTAGDDTWSYGIPMPTELDAGRYRFARRHTTMDVFHIVPDDIDEVIRFPRALMYVSPDTTDNVSPGADLDWEDVPGAGAYYLSYSEYASSSVTTVGPLDASVWEHEDFTNRAFHQVVVEIYDVDPEDEYDIDARGRTVPFYWSTDRTGGDTVVITGTFDNRTSDEAPIFLEASSFDGGRVSQMLPADATTWAISYYYPAANESDIHVRAFLDVDGSASADTPGNTARLDEVSNIVEGSPLDGYELVFEDRLLLDSPMQNANVGATPTLSWLPLSGEVPSGEYQFMVRVDDISTGPYEAVWAVDGEETSIDFSDLSEAIDVGAIVSCAAIEGGVYSEGACSDDSATESLATFASGKSYRWEVFVSECDSTDTDDADENGQTDFVDCLLGYGRGSIPAFNRSDTRDFTVN